MAGDFLKRSRHGTTFFFRRRVPQDLCKIIGRAVVVKSLGTEKRRDAVVLARSLAAQTDAIFHQVRTMSKNLRTDYSFSIDLKELRLTVNDAKAEDQAAIDSHITTVLKNLPANGSGSAPVAHTAKPRSSKTIMQVWEEYKSVMLAKGQQADVKGGWSNPGRVNVEQFVHVEAFIDYIGGDRPIVDVTDEDVASFRTYTLTTQEIKASGSRKTRLNRSGALFRYAKEQRIIADGFLDLFKFTGQIKKNQFQKFSQGDLVALFESEAYRHHKFDNSSKYWLPLLSLHSGARLNELCQLLKSDIGKYEGVDAISILDEEESKRLKTDAARRIVPIHSKLVELGFLDFVESIPSGRIFPHLREDPNKPGDYGQKATEDFTHYRRSVGVGGMEGEGKSRKVFHSFRSTFIDALRKADVPEERRKRLVGHEFGDTHNSSYDGGDILDMFSMATLKKDVECARFDINFARYRP